MCRNTFCVSVVFNFLAAFLPRRCCVVEANGDYLNFRRSVYVRIASSSTSSSLSFSRRLRLRKKCAFLCAHFISFRLSKCVKHPHIQQLLHTLCIQLCVRVVWIHKYIYNDTLEKPVKRSRVILKGSFFLIFV